MPLEGTSSANGRIVVDVDQRVEAVRLQARFGKALECGQEFTVADVFAQSSLNVMLPAVAALAGAKTLAEDDYRPEEGVYPLNNFWANRLAYPVDTSTFERAAYLTAKGAVAPTKPMNTYIVPLHYDSPKLRPPNQVA
jgi:hypothetical protein